MPSESVLDHFDRAPEKSPDDRPVGREAVEEVPDSDASDPRGHPRQWLGVLAVVAVAAAGIGYSVVALGGDNPGGPIVRAKPAAIRPTASAPTVPRPAAPSTAIVPAPAQPAGLAAPVFAPPAPWRLLPDSAAGTGRVDLARAAAIDGHGELSRTALHKDGFVIGSSRSWQSGSAVLLVLDYTFRTRTAAAAYVTAARRSRAVDPAFTPRAVSGIPGAGSFDATSTATSITTSSVIFSVGRTAYLLALQGPPPAGKPGDVSWLALRQYARATG